MTWNESPTRKIMITCTSGSSDSIQSEWYEPFQLMMCIRNSCQSVMQSWTHLAVEFNLVWSRVPSTPLWRRLQGCLGSNEKERLQEEATLWTKHKNHLFVRPDLPPTTGHSAGGEFFEVQGISLVTLVRSRARWRWVGEDGRFCTAHELSRVQAGEQTAEVERAQRELDDGEL